MLSWSPGSRQTRSRTFVGSQSVNRFFQNMPNRYLREAYIESESVSSLSWQAEVTWTRLIVTVDDWGRCDANVKLLRPKLFPLRLDRVREAELQRWLAECEAAGLLRRYEVNGKSYLQMTKWERGRAEKSKFPESPEIADGRLQPYTTVSGGIQMRPTPTPTPIPISTPIPTPTSAPNGTGELPLEDPSQFPPELDDPQFHAAWADWTAYRRERRLSTLKPRSVQAQFKELAKIGTVRSCEAIQHSIRQNYQGIYEPNTSPSITSKGGNPFQMKKSDHSKGF